MSYDHQHTADNLHYNADNQSHQFGLVVVLSFQQKPNKEHQTGAKKDSTYIEKQHMNNVFANLKFRLILAALGV